MLWNEWGFTMFSSVLCYIMFPSIFRTCWQCWLGEQQQEPSVQIHVPWWNNMGQASLRERECSLWVAHYFLQVLQAISFSNFQCQAFQAVLQRFPWIHHESQQPHAWYHTSVGSFVIPLVHWSLPFFPVCLTHATAAALPLHIFCLITSHWGLMLWLTWLFEVHC